MTVEGSRLFAYHALDTICGRCPSARPLGVFVVAAAATALRRKEGERGRGCARGGGCEDDYPEAEGGRARPVSWPFSLGRTDRAEAAADCPPYRVLLGGAE